MQQHQPGLQITPQAVQTPPQAVQWQIAAPPVELPPDTQTSPKQRKGAPLRLATGIIHLCLGFVLIVCGIIVLSVHFPEPGYDTYTRMQPEGIDRRDRQVWPIWFGVVVLFNAALGMMSRRSQVVISLYMAFSIVSSVAAFIVMVPVSIQVGTSNRLRLEVAQEMPTNGRADYNNPCSYSRANYDSSGGRFDLPAQQTICVEETLSTAKLHMGFHCVMLICLVVEFVVAILSATSTCFGLDCCTNPSRTQQVLYYQTQIPQFQSPVVFVNPNEPPPAYTSLLTSAPNQSPSSPAAVGVLSSGQPQRVAVPSPSPQSPGETRPTPDARGTPTQNPQDDDGLYVTPDAAPDRPPLAAPHSANEYSYADTQYRPAPPAYSNDRFHREDSQPDGDQNYITVTN